jgi:hypothetical protein
MKLSEIITRVQRQFGDDVQAQITTEDIVRWVNDACLEIATSNKTTQGSLRGQTAVVANTSLYDLPADLLYLRSVRCNGIKLTRTTYEQITESEEELAMETGTPSLFWVYENQVNIYPIPDTAQGTVDIFYVKTPDTLLSSMLDREPDVPVMYHPRIVEYCIAQAAELDDNIPQYQLKMNQFDSKLKDLRGNGEQPEGDDYYPEITYVSTEYI